MLSTKSSFASPKCYSEGFLSICTLQRHFSNIKASWNVVYLLDFLKEFNKDAASTHLHCRHVITPLWKTPAFIFLYTLPIHIKIETAYWRFQFWDFLIVFIEALRYLICNGFCFLLTSIKFADIQRETLQSTILQKISIITNMVILLCI